MRASQIFWKMVLLGLDLDGLTLYLKPPNFMETTLKGCYKESFLRISAKTHGRCLTRMRNQSSLKSWQNRQPRQKHPSLLPQMTKWLNNLKRNKFQQQCPSQLKMSTTTSPKFLRSSARLSRLVLKNRPRYSSSSQMMTLSNDLFKPIISDR